MTAGAAARSENRAYRRSSAWANVPSLAARSNRAAFHRENEMRAIRIGATVLALMGLVGCATSFTGDPHVEDGRAGCEKKCRADGMEFAGMVYMGEYSDACVCEAKGHGSASSGRRDMLLGSSGAGGGAAGVWMQMVAAQRQAQQATYH